MNIYIHCSTGCASRFIAMPSQVHILVKPKRYLETVKEKKIVKKIKQQYLRTKATLHKIP